jgi:DNA-binding transcriptional LysR family regulator
MQNWDNLRLFLAVARGRTLSAAGRLVKLDPATLSRRIARLERDLGQVLFVKSVQGYELTHDGARLMERAEAVEQALAGTGNGASAQGASNRLTGQVRIGAPDGCANYLLPQVCARIARDHPDLDIQIVALPRVFNLSRREADMAITVSPPTAGRLTVQKVCEYHLHLAVAPTYLQGRAPVLTLDDLKHHPVIGYIPDMIFDKELDYLSSLGVPRVALASNSVAVQLNWIRQGGGIGIAHDFALPVVGGVTRILTDKLSLQRSFFLVRHADDKRDTRLTRFAKALSEGLRAETSRLEALA